MRKGYRLLIFIGLFLLVVLTVLGQMEHYKTDKQFVVGEKLELGLDNCRLVFKEGSTGEGSIEAYGHDAFDDLGDGKF